MMEDVQPKQPRARQTIVILGRSFGYDLLTFAINRSEFFVHEKTKSYVCPKQKNECFKNGLVLSLKRKKKFKGIVCFCNTSLC